MGQNCAQETSLKERDLKPWQDYGINTAIKLDNILLKSLDSVDTAVYAAAPTYRASLTESYGSQLSLWKSRLILGALITLSSRGGVGVWRRCWRITAFVLRRWGTTSLREAKNTPLESTWVKLFPSCLTGKLAKPGKRSKPVLPGCQEGN